MQFYIEDKILRRHFTPALHQHRLRHRIKCGIHFHHVEMVRIPPESVSRPHLFWIPKFDESRVRPTSGTDADSFSGHQGLNCACNQDVLNLNSKLDFYLRSKPRSDILI